MTSSPMPASFDGQLWSEAPGFLPLESLWAMSVEQYHLVAKMGILKDGDPVELLEGRLVLKMKKSRKHSFANQQLRRFIQSLVPAGREVGCQDPITLSTSEPEPDLSIFRDYDDNKCQNHPVPAEVALVVEVADASLLLDQGWKLCIYAAARIPHYWIVNLIDNRIEWYADPTGGIEANATYRQRVDYPLGSTLVFPLDGKELCVMVDDKLIPTE